jgi:hypothetical protein
MPPLPANVNRAPPATVNRVDPANSINPNNTIKPKAAMYIHCRSGYHNLQDRLDLGKVRIRGFFMKSGIPSPWDKDFVDFSILCIKFML